MIARRLVSVVASRPLAPPPAARVEPIDDCCNCVRLRCSVPPFLPGWNRCLRPTPFPPGACGSV